MNTTRFQEYTNTFSGSSLEDQAAGSLPAIDQQAAYEDSGFWDSIQALHEEATASVNSPDHNQ